MRIALVIYGSLEQVSGGFIYDRALVNALAARGEQVDVITLPWHGYARAVVDSFVGSVVGRRAQPASATLEADGAGYDVVIEDELVHPSLFATRFAARAGGAPIRIALVHNLRSDQPSERWRPLKAAIERRYLGAVDGAIAVCARTRADVDALVGRPVPALIARPGRDHVAPGVDEAFADVRAAEAGPLRILHAAAVQPHKGLARLVAALAQASARGGLDFTLDAVGARPAGRYARRLQRQIAALGLGEHVRLHGELRGPALRDLFRRSQVFALPSDREAYSLACLEALGYGLPVLATSSGGLAEMITDGVEGFLIDPTATAAWAERLTALGADRTRLRGMAGAALARYREHATWEEVAARVQEFLRARCAGRIV
jgi:glycosyltransferase involved in cell wall biosynthesis